MDNRNKKLLKWVGLFILIAIIGTGIGLGIYKLINTNETVTVDSTIDHKGDAHIREDDNSGIDKSDTDKYILTIDASQKGVEISDMMYGIFFEDINFAADGGIYAELVKNRSFEFTEELANNGPLHGYVRYGDCSLEVLNKQPLNKNNIHYLQISNQSGKPAGFINLGFLEGMAFEEGESYRFSVYLRSQDYDGTITIKLLDKKNQELASATIDKVTDKWEKYTVELGPVPYTDYNGKLLMTMDSNGTLNVDMVSLFPFSTYKNRENGLRPDMVEMLAELNPSFIRFPGGCIVEGDPLSTAYRWKDTIGDISERKQNTNLWIGTREHPYYQSYGLGFFEYFLLCEDLGAEPIPVVNAGLSCQARAGNKSGTLAIGDELEEYIQDALDLIEFCNGSVDTKWGALRAELGHPEPFNLKYLAIGNENWNAEYFDRYSKFVKAIRSKYPDIKLITSAGPASDGALYEFAWNTLRLHRNDTIKYADLVDEHYYNSPEWFLSNTHRYDSYERNFVDVFVGEYASKSNTLYSAIAEAAFMTGLERNGDVVKMASYAPLFGNLISRQWEPDLIYFNNHTVFGSINYYVQKMFSNNVGDYTLKSELEAIDAEPNSIKGKVGVGTWWTSAVFDDIKIIDNETGSVLYKTDFQEETAVADWKSTLKGNWKIIKEDDQNFVYGQTDITQPTDNALMGTASYIGDVNWSNYTYTLRAKKLDGKEGFLIPFAVQDGQNFYHWNIGGWLNTQTCIEQAQGGSKNIVSDIKNITVVPNKWYDIKIVVNPDSIRCYLDGKLIHDLKLEQVFPVYHTVSKEESSGDIIIKLVNAGEKAADITINISNADNIQERASLELLTGDNKKAQNTILNPENVVPVKSTIEISDKFIYTAPPYSLSIIRIPTK